VGPIIILHNRFCGYNFTCNCAQLQRSVCKNPFLPPPSHPCSLPFHSLSLSLSLHLHSLSVQSASPIDLNALGSGLWSLALIVSWELSAGSGGVRPPNPFMVHSELKSCVWWHKINNQPFICVTTGIHKYM